MATQNPLPTDDTTTPVVSTLLTASPPDSTSLDLRNIQGDILSGLPKKTESWYFFQITNRDKFKSDLLQFIPLVKTVEQVLEDRKAIEKHRKRHHQKPILIPIVGVNIAFSHFGFKKLEFDDSGLGDDGFKKGQLADAEDLCDKGTKTENGFDPDWEESFKQELHGVIIIAGDSHLSVNKKIQQIEQIFGVDGATPSLTEITTIRGDARPGDLSAHEHFGYLDGVSNPAIIDFDVNTPPGPKPVPAGVILLGQDGDQKKAEHDNKWMKDGSFLVFRYLFQKVPEFDDFVQRNALTGPGMSTKEGADLLGARLVGRWKSGAPVDITPFDDDEELGGDFQRNNNFSFAAESDFQKLCPFAAHVRKTLPRADLDPFGGDQKYRIMRRGIQFGPEVTKQEKAAKKTFHGRGLLFACYQSSIFDGFQFIQKSWSNNANFPPRTTLTPGLDPIIGQGKPADEFKRGKITGYNPNDPKDELELDDIWVVPRGGEYFFSPSLKGLNEIAK